MRTNGERWLPPTRGVVDFTMSHNVSFTTIQKWKVEGRGKKINFQLSIINCELLKYFIF